MAKLEPEIFIVQSLDHFKNQKRQYDQMNEKNEEKREKELTPPPEKVLENEENAVDEIESEKMSPIPPEEKLPFKLSTIEIGRAHV